MEFTMGVILFIRLHFFLENGKVHDHTLRE